MTLSSWAHDEEPKATKERGWANNELPLSLQAGQHPVLLPGQGAPEPRGEHTVSGGCSCPCAPGAVPCPVGLSTNPALSIPPGLRTRTVNLLPWPVCVAPCGCGCGVCHLLSTADCSLPRKSHWEGGISLFTPQGTLCVKGEGAGGNGEGKSLLSFFGEQVRGMPQSLSHSTGVQGGLCPGDWGSGHTQLLEGKLSSATFNGCKWPRAPSSVFTGAGPCPWQLRSWRTSWEQAPSGRSSWKPGLLLELLRTLLSL